MIIKIIVFGCIICTISTQNDDPYSPVNYESTSPNFNDCLTGYMTDIQSWVNANGSLTISPLAALTALDLSHKSDALPVLLSHLTTRKRRYPLRYLSLARCGLREIPQIFAWPDGNNNFLSETVEYLTFYGNNFDVPISTDKDYDVLLNATKPRELLGGSLLQISRSWTSGFTGLTFPKLRELDLRACSIAVLEDQVFAQMTNLESLYLGENSIVHIEANAFSGLKSLVHLDLSRNFHHDELNAHKSLALESMDLFKDLNNLQSLDFSFTKLTQRNILLLRSLSPKLVRLSLCYCSLARLVEDILTRTSIKYLDLSGNYDILSESNALRGLEQTLNVLYAEEIALKTMEPFKNMRNLEILKLTGNEINALPKNVVETLNNLQILDLDKNRMITWFDTNVSLMPKLRFLSLRQNNMNVISDEMATVLANVSYVALAENFIICSCNARDLYELGWRNENRVTERAITQTRNDTLDRRLSFHIGFHSYNDLIDNRSPIKRTCDNYDKCDKDLELNVKGKVLFVDYNPKDYECLLVTERRSIGFQKLPTCKEELKGTTINIIQKSWNKYFLLIIPVTLLPTLAILFLFRRNLQYCFIMMRNSATLSLINKNKSRNNSTIFNYDVFVSYCNEDRVWVLDQLLPHVERDCNISVCLHERDFQVGLTILENIVSCMDRSRSIMLILSRRFLLSQWCQFEMHLAQHRLLETRREDLILILLEDIPRRLRPNTLHYLMLTKTYIVWPKTEGEIIQFWKRLKKCLVTNKLKHTENVSLA